MAPRKSKWKTSIEIVDLTGNSSDPEPEANGDIAAEAALKSFVSVEGHASGSRRVEQGTEKLNVTFDDQTSIAPEKALENWEPRKKSQDSSALKENPPRKERSKVKHSTQDVQKNQAPGRPTSFQQHGVKRRRVDEELTHAASTSKDSQKSTAAQEPQNGSQRSLVLKLSSTKPGSTKGANLPPNETQNKTAKQQAQQTSYQTQVPLESVFEKRPIGDVAIPATESTPRTTSQGGSDVLKTRSTPGITGYVPPTLHPRPAPPALPALPAPSVPTFSSSTTSTWPVSSTNPHGLALTQQPISSSAPSAPSRAHTAALPTAMPSVTATAICADHNVFDLRNGAHPQGLAEVPISQQAVVTESPTNLTVPVIDVEQTRERQDAVGIIESYSNLPVAELTTALASRVRERRTVARDTLAWTPEEDAILLHAKEQLLLPWESLWKRFLRHRGRSWHTTQSRYSQKLKHRPGSIGRPTNDLPTTGPLESDLVSRYSTRLRPLAVEQRVRVTTPEAGYESIDDDSSNRPATVAGNTFSRQNNQAALDKVPFTTIISSLEKRSTCLTEDEKERNEAALASISLKLHRICSPPSKDPLRRNQAKRQSIEFKRPYLSNYERQFLEQSTQRGLWAIEEMVPWQDQVLHVDFEYEEAESLYPAVLQVMDSDSPASENLLIDRLSNELKSADDNQILKIARCAQAMGGVYNRTIDSLQSFLQDLRLGKVNSVASYTRISLGIKQQTEEPSLASLCRARELGVSRKTLAAQSQRAAEDTYGPLWSFNGTSGDVNSTAWSPNGIDFAIGSAALTDDNSMQYNRPNNLLFGSLTRKHLKELPSHAIKRNTPAGGINASRSMQASLDPILYESVSEVRFSPDAGALISTGYDHFVRVTDVRTRQIRSWSFRHKSEVDVLSVNDKNRIFATGSKNFTGDSVRVFQYDFDVTGNTNAITHMGGFYSPKAKSQPNKEMYPSSLEWGPSIYGQNRYLMAGFTSKIPELVEGEVCIWDVEHGQPTISKSIIAQRGTRNIFDIAWSPSIFGRFAVASSAVYGGSHRVNKGTHSIVRIFDSRLEPHSPHGIEVDNRRTYELECPARDINDVIFNPCDGHLISTGCTDGRAYIWDIRKPDELLHRFGHGPPAQERDADLDREDIDTGVRFLSWGGSRRLYTGSSDGVVAKWDPYRAPQDACIGEVIQLESGVMSGSFSPDFSHLLLGEVRGTVTMLGIGQNDTTIRECEEAPLVPMSDSTKEQTYKALGIEPNLQSEIGSANDARRKIENGEISIKPFGNFPFRQAVQGPKYTGPFDPATDAEYLRRQAEIFQNRFKTSEPQDASHDTTPVQGLITEEEMGDSGEWKSRIPANFRFQGTTPGQPRSCDLVCFRCDWKLKPQEDNLDILVCDSCERSWRMDVLGYSRVKDSSASAPKIGVTRTPLHEAIEDAMTAALAEGMDADEALDALQLQGIEAWLHKFWDARPMRLHASS